MEFLTDIGQLIGTLALVGFITEAMVEIIKQSYPKPFSNEAKYFMSVIIGIILCVVLKVSLFDQANAPAFWVGVVICGLVASRGANYVHNFLGNIKKA